MAVLVWGRGATAQEDEIGPGRVLTTLLQWQKPSGFAPSERDAYGSLAIFYLDGTYAEVAASFIKTSHKAAISLNLNEGFRVRLGSWTRADDGIIRFESREILRDKVVREMVCEPPGSKRNCQPAPESALPGPSIAHTCRVDGGSATRIASALYCKGLVLIQPSTPINLSDFPSMVKHLVEMKKTEDRVER
jgi:hypothetical protein